MRKATALAALAAASTFAGVGMTPTLAGASSHREAPLIAQDPAADNTDVYMFKDTVDPTKVNILANFIGLESPAGGPLFNNFADDVEYRINVNNTGGASDDIVYKFRFHTVINQPLPFGVGVYNVGPITKPNDGTQVFQQTYSVERDDTHGANLLGSNLPVAPANPGPRSIGAGSTLGSDALRDYYETNLLPKSVNTLSDNSQAFAGPRKDAFFVDLGSIFDLVALRPLQSNHKIPTPPSVTDSHGGTNGPAGGVDGVLGKNVHTIALQLPITSLLAPGKGGTSPADGSIVGVYASSARQRVKVLDIAGGAPREAGRWVQVSRLGLPLINEVLIPLDQKDRWNASDPADDFKNGFVSDIVDPNPVKLLPVLYPKVFLQDNPSGCPSSGQTPTCNTPPGGLANRPDLVALATGQLIGAPASGPGSQAPADLLRENLAPSSTAGFPNGRTLTDNVVDTELKVLAGLYLPGYGEHADGTPDGSHPSHILTQGIDNSSDARITTHFPYIGSPIPGYYESLPAAPPA